MVTVAPLSPFSSPAVVWRLWPQAFLKSGSINMRQCEGRQVVLLGFWGAWAIFPGAQPTEQPRRDPVGG